MKEEELLRSLRRPSEQRANKKKKPFHLKSNSRNKAYINMRIYNPKNKKNTTKTIHVS